MNCRFIIATMLLMTTTSLATTRRVPSQYLTIQAGLDAAAYGDTVLVADGIFTGEGNKNLVVREMATVVISENGPERCIIDCQNNGRGFYFQDYASDAVISGFTITHGYVSGGYGIGSGGGIYLGGYGQRPHIENCIVNNNWAEAGGGIYCDYAEPIISNCIISENESLYGGGIFYIFVEDGMLSNCIISENRAYLHGGGIFGYWNSWVTISQCAIFGNSAQEGGGLSEEEGGFIFNNCIIDSNSSEARGGGLFLSGGGCIFNFCSISKNRAGATGGGIHAGLIDIVELNNCVVHNNQALGNGGGIWLGLYARSLLAIKNTIFCDNRGNGAICFSSLLYTTQISYNNFHHNQGGAFFGNIPSQLGQIVTVNHNGDSCDVYRNIFLDPLLADPDRGDYHLTWANYPLPDSTRSPCIDAGCPDSLYDPDGTIADMGVYFFDQRYVRPRPYVNVDNLESFHVGPNPFNPTTAISYTLQVASQVSLNVFDTAGRLVATLVDGYRPAGYHSITWDASKLSSGIYFCKMVAGEFRQVKKMVLVK